MGFLTERMETEICQGRYRFRVNPAFDTVLEVQRLFREQLPETVKVEQALKMFLINRRRLPCLEFPEKVELLQKIYKECVKIKQRPAVRQSMPVLDFEEDGEYIYSSFLLDYGIDLIDMQGILPWKKFIALFQGLSEHTKIREVMRIRGMEIPKYNGKNAKQIQEIQELKSYYALPVKGGGGQKGLDALFCALESQAVKNG